MTSKTESAHTPGPWIALLGQFDYSNAGERRVMVGDPDTEHYRKVADVMTVAPRIARGKHATPYNAPDVERDANARLIASAPELLRELDALVRLCDAWIDAGTLPRTKSCMDSARAAIARAKGQV